MAQHRPARPASQRPVAADEARGVAARPGFTLMEVLVAASIVSVAALAMLIPFGQASEARRIDVLRANATNLAAQQMERLGVLDYDTLLEDYGGGSTRPFRAVDGSTMSGPGLSDFALTIQTAEVVIRLTGETDAQAARFCRAVVTVDHPDVASVRLARLFARESP